MSMRNRQRGFSLIEALVGFLILSVGMLGIASLQTLSLKAGNTASLRSVAVIKASEIIERMRSNPTQLAAYNVSTGDSGTDNGCNDSTGTAVLCVPAAMAADDIFNWKNDLKSALPNNNNTTASIVVTPPGAGQALTTVTVTINWQERATDASTMVDQNYTVSTQMCGAITC